MASRANSIFKHFSGGRSSAERGAKCGVERRQGIGTQPHVETTDPHRFMDASGAENACGQAMKRKRDRENENAPQLTSRH
jgi:hypothetical protein